MFGHFVRFVQGFVFGILIGGFAGMILARPKSEWTLSSLENKVEVAKDAFIQGRKQAEQDLLSSFEEAKSGEVKKS